MEISEDIGEQIMQNLDKVSKFIDKVKKEKDEYEENFPKFPQIVGEKKNGHLHLSLERSLHGNLKKMAESKGISLSEYCRRRLRGVY